MMRVWVELGLSGSGGMANGVSSSSLPPQLLVILLQSRGKFWI